MGYIISQRAGDDPKRNKTPEAAEREKKMKYIIQVREDERVLEEFATEEEAFETLMDYERQDRYQGCYEPDFYEIVEVEE